MHSSWSDDSLILLWRHEALISQKPFVFSYSQSYSPGTWPNFHTVMSNAAYLSEDNLEETTVVSIGVGTTLCLTPSGKKLSSTLRALRSSKVLGSDYDRLPKFLETFFSYFFEKWLFSPWLLWVSKGGMVWMRIRNERRMSGWNRGLLRKLNQECKEKQEEIEWKLRKMSDVSTMNFVINANGSGELKT